VLSSISLIKQYSAKGDVEKIDKHVLRIKASVNHLTFILNDFLNLGKLEEGKIDAVFAEVSLKKLFSEILEEIHLSLKEGQEIKMMFEGERDTILTDERILRNILFNLISNASKYSEKNKNIYFTSRSLPTGLEITIRDEGIGIPESDQKYLFERFFRASNVSNIQGTGLGLNIVKRYAELLGGDIHFSSESGKGSTFVVTIPARI
jgi:signal transduction histidine kinase